MTHAESAATLRTIAEALELARKQTARVFDATADTLLSGHLDATLRMFDGLIVAVHSGANLARDSARFELQGAAVVDMFTRSIRHLERTRLNRRTPHE